MWKNYKAEQMKDGKFLVWSEYRATVYGQKDEKQEIPDDYKKMVKRDERRWYFFTTFPLFYGFWRKVEENCSNQLKILEFCD